MNKRRTNLTPKPRTTIGRFLSNLSFAPARPSLWMIPILLLALALRAIDLANTPVGAHYDEAANAILASEIARGARPLFIRAYTGKEVGYFYLAAAMIRAIGQPLFGLRLTSAFLGVFTVAASYRLVRLLFGDDKQGTRIALLTATLQASSLWAIVVSRLGFRPVLLPPLQALTLVYFYRGLRKQGRRPWLNWIWAGLWCGLSAYSYLAVRAFPILLGLLMLWVLVAWPAPVEDAKRPALRGRLVRLGQLALLSLVAALVFAPLGAFYLHNPQYFITRMGQVSVFSPEGGDSRWAPLWHAVRASFGMYIWRGDINWRYNVPGAPALWWPVGVFFLVGLGFGVWRLFARASGPDRTSQPQGSTRTRSPNRVTYGLLLLWLPVMLLPSILGGQDVELSLTMRAVGTQPVPYVWAALGLSMAASALERIRARVRPGNAAAGRPFRRWIVPGTLGLLLAANAARTTYQCFQVWGPSTQGYWVASGDLVQAAEYVNTQVPPEAKVYISSEHYRHPTMALLAERYAELTWLVGPGVIVLPPATDQGHETWMIYTKSAMPAEEELAKVFGTTDSSVPPIPAAPDGRPAFRVYRLGPGQVPTVRPQYPAHANLGHTLIYLGHDQRLGAVSGETLDVTLYWQVAQSAGERDDWTFFAHLVDKRGFRWGGETFFHYPSSQWQPGEVIFYHKQIPIDAGAPPGAYTLDLGVFSPSLDARMPVLDEAGQLAGTTIHVGPIEVQRAPELPEALPAMQQRLDVPLGDALTLLGSDRDRSDLRPGETLALTLHWKAEDRIGPGAAVHLWLEGAAGRVSLWQGDPVQGDYAFDQWQPPEYVRDRYALRIPLDLAAGDYALRLAVLDPAGNALAAGSGTSHSSINLGTLHIHASDRLWEPPAYDHEVGARLGEVAELVGYTLEGPADVLHPGDTLRLTLIWRSLGETETPYTVFTHLLDPNQNVRGQKDNPPLGGRYPTTLWAPQEIVVDPYEITVEGNAQPGRYVLEVGMYDPTTMTRLPVRSPTGPDADHVLLAQIEVK